MNTVGVLGVSGFVTFVLTAALTYRRSKRARRRPSQMGSATGPSVAVHLPSDDPDWQAYSERKAARKAKRRKVWAAGTAGSVGTAYTAPYEGYSSGCGGGGGCGGGCGGG